MFGICNLGSRYCDYWGHLVQTRATAGQQGKMPLCCLHMKIQNAAQSGNEQQPGKSRTESQGGMENLANPQMQIDSSLKQRSARFATVTQRLVNSLKSCTKSLRSSWIGCRTDRSWGHWFVCISLSLFLPLSIHPLSIKVSLAPPPPTSGFLWHPG